MISPISSPVPPPAEFQAHIYNSFLQGKTSDVTLRIRASWDAVYKFHRVVLIQAEFFRHLFTGGFVESEGKDSSLRSSVPSPIEVVFDDTNITRAGTLCVARLYGGGPLLFVDPAIVPTPFQPLTPSFPNPLPPTQVPLGHQPATPRFLLSLLAVSVYLSMPSLTAQALSSIVNTIGPFTIMDYLRFAYGEGIGPLQEGDLDPLVGLEHVAHLVKADSSASNGISKSTQVKDLPSVSEEVQKHSELDQVHGAQEDPAEVSSESGSPTSFLDETESDLFFSYGAVSDKIGEACVGWLARWGADMLIYEQQATNTPKQPAPFTPASTPARAIGRRSTVSGWRTPNPDVVPSPSPIIPLIWRRGGLTAAWVRTLVSSDLLFIRGERERYDLARAVVELRRGEGIQEEEEVEWAKMFAEGIYYANMSFDDLVHISHDRSPTTGHRYVPERVLQAAHWTQSLLRLKIVGHPPSSPPASPTGASRHKELGISVSRKDIKEALSHPDSDEASRAYWPVPGPSSMRMGECAGVENASMDELFGLSSISPKPRSPGRSLTSISGFFGLKNDRYTATECASDNSPDPIRWVPYPPYRFAVEFWDVDSLREKSHLYSQTIWYAGSLFNVFVQMFRKKAQGAQLGIYLHRQSSVDPIPPLSIPPGLHPVEKLTENKPYARNLSSPSSLTLLPTFPTPYSMVPSPRPNTPIQGSPSNSSLPGSGLPATGPSVIPSQPYRDPRAQISAYFAISCANATGSSVTRFTSNPDDFSVSQSWGWRSSSLRTEVCVYGDKNTCPSPTSSSEDISSVRVTVVLGVV
ncbi:hypothetical protein B0F90DRAFT_1620846 [Multifurca ochricompacta]|uniref:BTB domain-containing protein n=1 Tax=Multifurca ochricompacta TaxID=376703 RepID=A0AAD4MBU1_9AGAM|nr:hypothetical protein B0F90DRAFT_1620846 [Multifurca ochricompacta]